MRMRCGIIGAMWEVRMRCKKLACDARSSHAMREVYMWFEIFCAMRDSSMRCESIRCDAKHWILFISATFHKLIHNLLVIYIKMYLWTSMTCHETCRELRVHSKDHLWIASSCANSKYIRNFVLVETYFRCNAKYWMQCESFGAMQKIGAIRKIQFDAKSFDAVRTIRCNAKHGILFISATFHKLIYNL